MKVLYNKFLDLLSKNNRKTINNFSHDLLKNLDSSIIMKKYSLTINNQRYYNYFIEEKNISVELLKSSLIFSIKTNIDDNYHFETQIHLTKPEIYSLQFYMYKPSNEKRNSLCLSFEHKESYSYTTLDKIVNSVLLEKNELINTKKSENIISLILENLSSPTELKDLLLINFDITIEHDEVISNIYNHLCILNNIKKVKNINKPRL